jgi:hypothetical protein
MGIRMVELGRAERVGGARCLEVLWISLDSSRRVSSWFRFGPIDFCELRTDDERLEKIDKPTVLFTHIPLSRPDGTDCGPLREKGTITRGAGHGYQNTLNEEASNFLLQNLKPSIIFRSVIHSLFF